MKFKTSNLQKTMSKNENTSHRQGENICKRHTVYRAVIQNKETVKTSIIKKNPKNLIRNGPKTLTDNSPKKTQRWQISI